ncbi:hypothetical protein HDU96_009661 [Phlyctochytrium bullatum]|nr:hypothetical protein HDU96_009661 [Phlyctochytrium bullatum]
MFRTSDIIGHFRTKQLGMEHFQGLLLNAEAFGLGPSSATAQLFDALRPRITRLGYIGEGHTLSLQEPLEYDDLVRVDSSEGDEEIRKALRRLSPRYSHFFTSMDFGYAGIAVEEGFRVGFFDALIWYYESIPEVIQTLDLYIAQDFVGVKDRIRKESDRFPAQTRIVPPIVAVRKPQDRKVEHNSALVNLGGLSNPLITNELMARFASILARACHEALEPMISDVLVVTIPAFVEQMPPTFTATTLSPTKVRERLESSGIAMMTSGLGNLFEASASGRPITWLPPTNDSQGQQIELMKRKGYIDWFVDWTDFTEGPAIDYFRPQELVMKEICDRMLLLIENAADQARLVRLLSERAQACLGSQDVNLKIGSIVETFGQGGVKELADIVVNWTTGTGIND